MATPTATSPPTAGAKSPARLLVERGQDAWEAFLGSLSLQDQADLAYLWEDFWARPAQLPPPGDWRIWIILAGRAFGKTRSGAEWVRSQVESGRCRRMALIGPTAADARDVMVEGESGLLAVCPPKFRPTYEPSKRRLTWPNGALATLYSADEPERLRGPQHDGGWLDELGAWRYPATWDMYAFGNRLRDAFGGSPRTCITTTPKPTALLLKLLDRVDREPMAVRLTGGSTYDNAENIAPDFLLELKQYEGSRLGLQEIHAHVLRDTPGALWDLELLERRRLFDDPPGVKLSRVVVAIDPGVTSDEGTGETGIVVVGKGTDGRAYVLEDCSLRGAPVEWARRAIKAYDDWRADRVVAERNNGGEMIEHTLRSVRRSIPYSSVWASRGKQTRAEPVAALYEVGKVVHMGVFPMLESQMTTWVPGLPSPDRMDALVWGVSDLMLGGQGGAVLSGGERDTLSRRR
jgi:phage terminase large subunit-like protein